GSGHREVVLTRIQIERQVPSVLRDGLAVEVDALDRARGGELEDDPRQLRLERAYVLHGELVPIALVVLSRPRGRVGELVPGRDELADRLVAEREVEQRPQLRSELQALGEIVACTGVVAAVELLLAGAEQLLRTRVLRERHGTRL